MTPGEKSKVRITRDDVNDVGWQAADTFGGAKPAARLRGMDAYSKTDRRRARLALLLLVLALCEGAADVDESRVEPARAPSPVAAIGP